MALFTKNKIKSASGKRFFTTLLTTLLVIVGVGSYLLFFEGEKPKVTLGSTNNSIGKQGTIHYTVEDTRSGIQHITIWAEQGDVKKELYTVSFPRTSYTGTIGPIKDAKTITFDVIKEGFKDGLLTISAEAADFSLRNWFQGNTTTIVKQVTVDTIPPRVEILHTERYISPGGSGIAIYKLSDQQCTHGVNINGKFYRGYALGDGRPDTFIAYFALPYDATAIENTSILAVDQAGNQTLVPFAPNLKPANQKHDNINISDAFLDLKIPEFQQYYPELQGDNLEKYISINNKLRIQNNAKIAEICEKTSPERLWKDAFGRMPGSPRAGFADHRAYFYKGRAFDNQVHLGMDIASTEKANVRSANYGVVVFTDYMGIYGNMIVIDHGQGVFSLYSHLSQINVKPGDKVTPQSLIGLTGHTGMAAGDHLHFSILVNGVFVSPTEWWDPHWIEVTINRPIAATK